MAVRDIKTRYSGSLIGVFWSFIHPLIMFLTYSFVFSFVFKARLGPHAGTDSFALWLFCGLAPWMFFSDTLMRSNSAIISNKPLITKSIFPSELLPLSIVVSNFLNHLAIVFLLLIVMTFMGYKPHFYIFLLPLYAVSLIMFATGVAWIVAGVNVFFRDLEQAFIVLVNFMFFYTPILYEPLMVPEGLLREFLKINPFYHIVEGYRLCILGTGWPHIKGLLYVIVSGTIVCISGGLLFRRLKSEFAEVL